MRPVCIALLVAAGCNQLFGLDGEVVFVPPDADANDLDGDGIPNADDNCPTAVNTLQHDEDTDGIGDTCDSCPLAADVASDGDGDGIDDVCDRFDSSQDCMVLFDTFDQPLDAEWDVTTLSGTADAVGGALTLVARPQGRVEVLSKRLRGPSALEVHATGLSYATDASSLTLVLMGNGINGYSCVLNPGQLVVANTGTAPVVIPIAPPILATDTVELYFAIADQSVRCGYRRNGNGEDRVLPLQVMSTGDRVGLFVLGADAEISAASIHQPRAGECPVPVVR